MRILGRSRPGRLDSTVATGESNRKPFLRHRKAMGIFESTNGGRLAHSGGRSLVDRAAWQQPMNFVTLPDLSRSAAVQKPGAVSAFSVPRWAPVLESQKIPESLLFWAFSPVTARKAHCTVATRPSQIPTEET